MGRGTESETMAGLSSGLWNYQNPIRHTQMYVDMSVLFYQPSHAPIKSGYEAREKRIKTGKLSIIEEQSTREIWR